MSEWTWIAIAGGAAMLVLAATFAMRRTAVAPAGVSIDREPRLVTDMRAAAKRRGWNCIDVDADESSPAFSYTVGLGAKRRPDLLLIWDADRAARTALLDSVAETVTKLRGPIPTHFEPLGPGRVRLNRVYDEEFFAKCPLAALWNSMHGVEAGSGLQIVFADASGHYPD